MSPGGSSQPLANLTIQFVLAGQKELQASLDQLKSNVDAFAAAVDKMAEQATISMKKVVEQTTLAKSAMAGLSSAVTGAMGGLKTALAAGVASVSGFVTAGLATGAMGVQLQFTFERLSRTISGLFRPEIEKVIGLVQQVTDWLHSLSDSQKEALVKFIELGAAALAFATGGIPGAIAGTAILGLAFKDLGPTLAKLTQQLVRLAEALQPVIQLAIDMLVPVIETVTNALSSMSMEMLQSIIKWTAAIGVFYSVLKVIPRVVAAIRTVIAAIKALTTAQIIQQAMSGPKGWAQLAAGALIAAGAVGAAAATFNKLDKAFDEFNKKKGSGIGTGTGKRDEDMKRLGGFEDLGATYRRIAQASRYVGGAGKSPERRMIELQQEMVQLLNRIDKHTENPPAPFRR